MKKPEPAIQELVNAITMHEIMDNIRELEKKQSQPNLYKIKKEWRHKQK